jgi:hypothetical protein
VTAPARPDPLDYRPVREQVMAAAVAIREWRGRQTTAERTYVSAGHAALASIDEAVRLLYGMRARLQVEIRQDELEREVRVEQLLAQVRRERFGELVTARGDPTGWQYSRSEDQTVVAGPLPQGVYGENQSVRREQGRHG